MTSTLSADPKVSRILSFLNPLLRPSRDSPSIPFVLALSGIQGSGKSTLVSRLCASLRDTGYRPISVSLDDFYLPASELVAAAQHEPYNKLLKQRGQPGTHDVRLANETFEKLRRINEPGGEHTVLIPSYDKGAHNGRGDRRPREEWTRVEAQVDVVVFEGWCVGFEPSTQEHISELVGKGTKAVSSARQPIGPEVLLQHHISHLFSANDHLAEYCDGFMNPQSFDAVVHLDTEDLHNVYAWRLEQEHQLREATGQGMGDREVELFGEIVMPSPWVSTGVVVMLIGKFVVLRYMPAYVLYLDRFQKGICPGRQLRISLDRERRMIGSVVLWDDCVDS